MARPEREAARAQSAERAVTSSRGRGVAPRRDRILPATAGGGPAGRRGLTLLLGAAAVSIGVLRAVQLAWTSDDAYISFRYARNLVDGLGLVYNAGERVEGYSNFLWTLWSALGLRL